MFLARTPRGHPGGLGSLLGAQPRGLPPQPGWGPALLSAPLTWRNGEGANTPCPLPRAPSALRDRQGCFLFLPIKAGLDDFSQLLSDPLIGVWTGAGAARGSGPCWPAGSLGGLLPSSRGPSPCRPLGQPQGSCLTLPHPASIASAGHPFPLCFQISGEPLSKAPWSLTPSPAAPSTGAVSQLTGPARQGRRWT